jgi:4-hydroxybenzoate polyprenyltransferase
LPGSVSEKPPRNQYLYTKPKALVKFIQVLAPKQWLKNLLLFIPAIFARVSWNIHLLTELFTAFIGFSIIASAVYIHNDITDKTYDQKHPEKKKRSIASGAISNTHARVMQFILITIGLLTLWWTSLEVMLLGVAYLAVNLVYSQLLKHIPLIDLLPILFGYFIRLLIGATIAAVPLSIWVIAMVGLLALYLVLMKRQGDVDLFRKSNIELRKTVAFYNTLNLPLITAVLIHLIPLVYAAYIHFVFRNYTQNWHLLPYATIPLIYIAILNYHKRSKKQVHQDPLSTLLQNTQSLLLILFSFTILLIALYPNT